MVIWNNPDKSRNKHGLSGINSWGGGVYVLVLYKGTVFLLNSDVFSCFSISFLHDLDMDFESF